MTTDTFETKTFEEPDDRMALPHGHADVINAGGHRVQRAGR
jgi:hypothetical protein